MDVVDDRRLYAAQPSAADAARQLMVVVDARQGRAPRRLAVGPSILPTTGLRLALRDTRISTIGAVLDGDDKGRQFTACMWHAVWRGDLLCDLDRQLSRSTSVSRPRAEAPA